MTATRRSIRLLVFTVIAVVSSACSTLPPLEADDPRQPALLQKSLAQVAEQRPGIADVYFIGGALWASEGVFRREVDMARAVFDERLDSRGRSLVLVNHHATADTTAFATGRNLAAALEAVASKMDLEEDVLVVFLSTHGSPDGRLVLDMGGKQRSTIAASWLKGALDKAKVKWRVVIISACYSGGFATALADPNTLIVTAADAQHPSFGCGDTTRLTFFGEAYLEKALRRSGSLIDAFAPAQKSLRDSELRERFDHSNPQFVLGDAMRDKLRAIEARLSIPRNRGLAASSATRPSDSAP
jgi:Peptidase C13 family